jgi:hypothetical protein
MLPPDAIQFHTDAIWLHRPYRRLHAADKKSVNHLYGPRKRIVDGATGFSETQLECCACTTASTCEADIARTRVLLLLQPLST